MNILFVYYYPSGGVETLARQRSNALKKHGINFHFLYFSSGPGLQNIKENPIFVTNNQREIQGIITKGNYQVIIVCSDHTFLPKLRSMNYKGKIIYEVQGLGPVEAAKNWLQSAQSIINQNADAILYPKTPHLINLIGTYYPSKKKYSFHNCIDTMTFSYRKMQESWQFPIIGWVGRLEENKNWRGFLEIGHELIRYNPAIKLWMFLDYTLATPNELHEFKNMIIKLQLNNDLNRIYNNVPHAEMANYYSMIKDSGGFLCSTSKVEGFGYAIVEAMSCGCPILTTDSDGVKSFVFHNETGKIYPQNNKQKAVEEAKSLFVNKALREKISSNAQRYIHQHFNPDTYAKNFLNMLRDLGVK